MFFKDGTSRSLSEVCKMNSLQTKVMAVIVVVMLMFGLLAFYLAGWI